MIRVPFRRSDAPRRPSQGVRETGRKLLRPFVLALFEGDADPPFAARRLTFRTPRWLGALVPARSYDLVRAADLLLAVLLYGIMISTGLDWNDTAARAHIANPRIPGPAPLIFMYLIAIGVSLPVALRDRWPLAAWRVAAVMLPLIVYVTMTVGDVVPPYPIAAILMYLLVLYSVAVRCERRITVGVWALTVLSVWIVHPDSMFLATIIASVAVLFGYNVRARRTATARLVEEEQRTREAESAQSVLEERARIARELHDVVAHHMSVIAIQAEAVPLKAAGDVAQLEAGLAEIRGLSLEAIAELRQVLGVLRDPQGRTDTAPQPGLDRVDELVSNARAAGLTVLVKRSGALGGQPQAVELSAYRIVQESLSNAMRHAPGATVAVDIARRGDELRLRIVNGPGAGQEAGSASPGGPGSAGGSSSPGGSGSTGGPGSPGRGAGQGLVGMRERAALLGGRLDAGPVDGGGFEVIATLPVAERESA
ncbi:sensor histidine kinase [Nonomuraea sp. PA05]|uniref:sensor histidine kinase n=1 Tax=Nonomuraea sp. PA05 TaxID=2604466 RepID=UPI0011DA0BF7|nr:histidine kinase [Nonomuraea sp. PA05]TYB59402.1 sensor histidine kinase [Nonomuraea sp. PA05]